MTSRPVGVGGRADNRHGRDRVRYTTRLLRRPGI
jgi:hypothetical protein